MTNREGGSARICLITGATEGVGRATAVALAQRGFKVVLAARDAAKAAAVKREIAALAGAAAADDITADLASLRQTRALAATFQRRYPRLDVLVNNAGVFLPRRTETEDGFEATYQINYLSHFLLTQLLLDLLKKSAQGRIINLSSSVHAVGRFDAGNLQSEKRFSVLGTYAASKLFMLMFTRELARRLAGTRVTANAAHPGIVRTRMMLRAPGVFRLMSYLSLPWSITPAAGARTSVYLASSPDVDGVSGEYFARSQRTDARSRFDTAENRARLWDLSLASMRQGAASARGAG
jgi:NAD(P)-dependent dehydrogenase (short-subunit alcohol dehydrogenase family)